MEDLLIVVGIACIVAAVIGGGLRITDIEFPLLVSIPRQILLAVVGVLLIASAKFDQLKPYVGFCPMIEGVWQSREDRLVMQLAQSSCNITMTASDATHDYGGYGSYDRSIRAFTWRIMRRNPREGCTTWAVGNLRVMSATLISTRIRGTDGRCDLPATYEEVSEWIKD